MKACISTQRKTPGMRMVLTAWLGCRCLARRPCTHQMCARCFFCIDNNSSILIPTPRGRWSSSKPVAFGRSVAVNSTHPRKNMGERLFLLSIHVDPTHTQGLRVSKQDRDIGELGAAAQLRPYLESVTVILVLLNAIVLGIEYQVEGEVVGLALLEGKECLVLKLCVQKKVS